MFTSLADKTIVLTRSKAGNQAWQSRLAMLGAVVYGLPTISTKPLALNADAMETLKRLDSFDWVILTSASGVRYFIVQSRQLGINPAMARAPKFAVIGSRTAAAANAAGLRISFTPTVSDSMHLADELTLIPCQRILLLRTAIATKDLPSAFEKRGAVVTDLRIYTTVPVSSRDPVFSRMLREKHVDYIVFASPSAVAGFAARLDDRELNLAKKLPVAAIGSSVSAALRQAGFLNISNSASPSIDGIIQTLQHIAV